MKRILVIRGGAIGDFILTLPGLKALRESYPNAHIAILGYAHITALAEKRFYADAVRSIEYGALSRFFARGAELPDDLAAYFADFDLIVSYLFDPDRIFQTNLERAGADTIVVGPSKVSAESHASVQLARPMTHDLGLEISSVGAEVFPASDDLKEAGEFLLGLAEPVVALHPGSGSEKKNWPLQNWLEVAGSLLADKNFTGSLLLVSGEADEAQSQAFRSLKANPRIRFAHNLPLPQLAAILGKTVFVGHDSGISHLAAAAGANCLLLFGPTDPAIWAPVNQNVEVIRPADSDLQNLSLDEVLSRLRAKIA
jgi:ADP-heptose:LPS heptosyltransferase